MPNDIVLPKQKLKPAQIDARIESLVEDTDRLYKSLGDGNTISPEAKKEVNAKIASNRQEKAAYEAQLKSMNITGLDEIDRAATNIIRKYKK